MVVFVLCLPLTGHISGCAARHRRDDSAEVVHVATIELEDGLPDARDSRLSGLARNAQVRPETITCPKTRKAMLPIVLHAFVSQTYVVLGARGWRLRRSRTNSALQHLHRRSLLRSGLQRPHSRTDSTSGGVAVACTPMRCSQPRLIEVTSQQQNRIRGTSCCHRNHA
jgi:hypothetical protein